MLVNVAQHYNNIVKFAELTTISFLVHHLRGENAHSLESSPSC